MWSWLSHVFRQERSSDLTICHLAELESDTLFLYGPGSLDALDRNWGQQAVNTITSVSFKFIDYDDIVPYLGKLQAKFPVVQVWFCQSSQHKQCLTSCKDNVSLYFLRTRNIFLLLSRVNTFGNICNLGHLNWICPERVSEEAVGRFDDWMQFRCKDNIAYLFWKFTISMYQCLCIGYAYQLLNCYYWGEYVDLAFLFVDADLSIAK